MKNASLVLFVVILSSLQAFATTPEKKWYVGLGTVWSSSLLQGVNPSTLGGHTNGGTKYNLDLAYINDLSERFGLLYFFDGSFNSATQGTTPIMLAGVGVNYEFRDRGADTSPFILIDAGYGASNRTLDASPVVGGGLGFDFFRRDECIFRVLYRHEVVVTQSGTNVPSFPSLDQLRLGIFF